MQDPPTMAGIRRIVPAEGARRRQRTRPVPMGGGIARHAQVLSRPSGADEVFTGNNFPPPTTTMSYLGGTVIRYPKIALLFYGTAWDDAANSPSAQDVIEAVKNILAGPYLSGAAQYGVKDGGFVTESHIVLKDPPNPSSPHDAASLAWDLIDQGAIPAPDDANAPNLYCVFLPPHWASSRPNVDGLHARDWDYDFPFDVDRLWYAWVTNNGTLDGVTALFSHELVEFCTDPSGDGWQIDPVNSDDWHEVGDVCGAGTGRLNGILVQAYFSLRDGACIIPLAGANEWLEPVLHVMMQ